MAATILQAPVSAGKTAAALDRLMAVVHNTEPMLARVWVLVATRRQEYAFRERLIERNPGRSVYSNVEFFNFYELNRRLLNLAGRPARRLDDAGQRGLLRHVLQQMQAENALETLADVALSPGFVHIIAGFIRELKQNLVTPEQFAGAVRAINAEGGKDRDLTAIYQRYQDTLHAYQLADQEGEGWLALEGLQQGPLPLPVDLLMVDGFDQFTPAQAALLAQMSQQVPEAIITLTTVPGREQSVGRRFERALDRLQAAHEAVGVTLRVEALPAPLDEGRSADLMHLEQHILKPSLDDRRDSLGQVRFLYAPEPVEEAAAISRRIKRLLLDGTAPDDIVIVLRDWGLYAPHLETCQRLYDLPYRFHTMPPHTTNPALSILLRVLQLQSNDFPQSDLLDVIRSPYIHSDLHADEIDKLDIISQRFQITRGRQNWLDGIYAARRSSVDRNGKTVEPILTAEESDDIAARLERFFGSVTPPSTATTSGFVAWLEELIGDDTQPDPDDDETTDTNASDPISLNMPANIRKIEADPALAYVFNRDMVAMNALLSGMNDMLSAHHLITHTLGADPGQRSWRDFFHELRAALSQQPDEHINPARAGQVLITTATDARGLPHRHVFIPGLSEGVFPQKLAEDPIYLDSERRRFQSAGIPLLTQNERADDDSLFYELMNLARETLTVSRSTVKDGKPWPESHLWRAAYQVFADGSQQHDSLAIGAVPKPEETASVSEALLSAADGLNGDQPAGSTAALVAWLQHTPDLAQQWAEIRRRRNLEQSRRSSWQHDRYSGWLSDAGLRSKVADALGPARLWSASQLNELGRCGGFYFFANRLLGLEALAEPGDEPDLMQLGTLRHDILQAIYDGIRQEKLTIEPANLERALTICKQETERILSDAPERYGFPQPILWAEQKAQITEQIEALVQVDFSDNPKLEIEGANRRPVRLEAGFGVKDTPAAQLDLGGSVGSIRLMGYIDRIDQTASEAVVIDYKSGSLGISTNQLSDGTNFQMLVYMAGARVLSQQDASLKTAERGMFWSLRTLKKLGDLDLNKTEHQDAIASGTEHLARYVTAARAGRYGVQPSSDGKCVNYCPYHELCRIKATYHNKD